MSFDSSGGRHDGGRRFVVPVLTFGACGLAMTTLTRLALLAWQDDRVRATGALDSILIQGLRFDLVLLGWLLGLPVLLLPLVGTLRPLLPLARRLLTSWLVIAFAFIVLMELTTPGFVAEYDARPNILFVEYLIYPREVLATLWGAFRAALIGAAVLLPALSLGFVWLIRRLTPWSRPLRFRTAIAISIIGTLVCFLAARSTFDRRPINTSMAALTSDALVNDLILNSPYSVIFAIYENRRDGDGAYRFGVGDIETVLRDAGIESTSGVAEIPTLHRQLPTRRFERPLNLVILLEESLGAEFVGALGGLPLTPNIDRLRDEGIWFENLYATGTRSARGLEAVVSGFPPTTARSVVKLQKTQRNFFTLAELLRRQGYDTSFLYGGEAHFDNMRRFFANNGFSKIVDKHDFDDPEFEGAWGVSDDDLFDHAHRVFAAAGERPFFSLVFTTTNHSPFEFPDGRIELYDEEKQTANNAVKYADHALGRYIETARASGYWERTVFLILSDHNSRVYGPSLLPVDRFHIPGVIIGGSISPQRIETLTSQIDMPPTLLSLIGVEAEHPAIGRDMTLPANLERPGRAIMHFRGIEGYREGDELILLRREVAPGQFEISGTELIPRDAVDPELLHRALSYADFPIRMIRGGQYRLPAESELQRSFRTPTPH